jgi:hypothetical protein
VKVLLRHDKARQPFHTGEYVTELIMPGGPEGSVNILLPSSSVFQPVNRSFLSETFFSSFEM